MAKKSIGNLVLGLAIGASLGILFAPKKGSQTRRELKEETNLDIIDLEMVKVLSGKDTYREYPNGDKLYDITAIYVVKKYSGDLKVNDNESKKLEWFNADNLPFNMTEHTKNYLNKFGNILDEALKIYKGE